jgi:hypothetical protein
MSTLIRILTAAVFTVHLLVGCCAHHSHACECQGKVQPAHGQCPDSHHGGADHSHHGSHNCQGSRCSFVSSNNANSHSLVQSSHAFFTVLLTDRPSLVGTGSAQHCFATGRLLPSVRLYLVNQVLLI